MRFIEKCILFQSIVETCRCTNVRQLCAVAKSYTVHAAEEEAYVYAYGCVMCYACVSVRFSATAEIVNYVG